MAYTITNQDDLRQNFEKHLANTGVKVCFISNKTGVSQSIISHWRKNRMILNDKSFTAVMNYLIQYK